MEKQPEKTEKQGFETVGIVGLGLIGGSFAKALSARTDCTVYACDVNETVFYKAEEDGVISGVLDETTIPACSLILIALYPRDAVNWLMEHCGHIAADTVVIDCCGVKRYVAYPMENLARSHGFVYVGGHPMAGREFSGYDAADGAVFSGAWMILIDPPAALLPKLESFFTALGFRGVQTASAEEHDRKIAYTSQLAHILSSSYVKSPTAMEHEGFSAGSFRSLTRVAYLNETMWTELFLENRDYLAEEIRILREHLQEYENALRARDANVLKSLLRDGRIRKEKVEGWHS